MPVAPDLLLQARPEVKPKAPAAKAPEKPAETNKGEASSFAQMYAKERQAKAAERSEAAAKQARDKANEAASQDTPVADPAASPPAVAESGKPLPAEEGDDAEAKPDEPVMDPLLLMGMTGEVPADTAPVEAALPVTPQVTSSAPATLSEASLDPDLDQLNGVPAVKMALEQSAQAAQQAQSAATQAAQAAPSADQDFADALAAFADKPLEAGEGKLDKALSSTELSLELTEGLGENKGEVRNELLASRLNALSQAVSQQTAQAQRAPALVPGQPVAMQQGGWSEAVVDRVMWLSSQNLKSAEIQLDPQELGRLEVRVHMTPDQTQVTFASANANVRDALEGQMHRLRDMFAQQGMSQPDVNVSDQSLNRGWQGQGGDGERRSGGGRADFGGGSDEEISVSHSEIRPTSSGSGRGLVDFYA
ncbi:flagellar hook-length control protein FliK [Pseudomonas taiwanensis]|uniref:flagellar hook-length control protein FliK n=1 Tax=Pseudomonas taiwanensis TaxID=470150 RepID=UPI0015C162FC|nr:flagellar hook-length control protein FliK [Pseudomonas taiwanensis]NWL78603.1 flagellar hook-length control protein FliK [Pseudomonas taiwanensis]